MTSDIHAVEMRTMTPDQWATNGPQSRQER